MTFKDCSDQTILNLWWKPSNYPTYEAMANVLLNTWGYEGATKHTVRRRVKQILHRRRMIPKHPTLRDFEKSRQQPGRHPDDLN
jgi:hypothetical protein